MTFFNICICQNLLSVGMSDFIIERFPADDIFDCFLKKHIQKQLKEIQSQSNDCR